MTKRINFKLFLLKYVLILKLKNLKFILKEINIKNRSQDFSRLVRIYDWLVVSKL